MPTDALRQKERELELILALDNVRDLYDDDEDPGAMFDSIVRLLKNHFETTACGLMLLAEDNVSTSPQHLSYTGTDAATAIQLCHQAMSAADLAPLDSAPWPHTLGIPIKLQGRLLGGVFVARIQPAFSEHEQVLLDLAESQIDSFVIQAHTIWKFMQRNRELEAIYEIDRLRDFTASEGDLISGFTSVLLKHFQAELCMIILSHVDSGELILRGLVDKNELPPATLEHIQQAAESIHQTTKLPVTIQGLHLLAAPLVVAGVRLGAVVIGRENPLTLGDHRLLTAMTTQMDSALVYSRVYQQLVQRTRELEVIYRIDQIRDNEKDFDTMLQKVLQELCSVISGEMGYIMLYNENHEEQLELKAATIDNLLTSEAAYQLIRTYSRRALTTGQPIHDTPDDKFIQSIIAVPLILNDRIIGVFGAVNRSPRGFTGEDRRLLTAITSQVDTAIFERLEQRRMRTLLSRSVDPKVLDRLLAQTDAARMLTGERVVLSVLFADLRGSTEWAERTEPEELVASINLYLSTMTDIIFKHGGTLDKFVGDEVIGLFGSPLFMEDHARRAALAALDMQAAHAALCRDLNIQGQELPPLGIGLSSGEVIAGEFGPPIRTDFTAMGRVVNLSSRLCDNAAPGQILISQSTYDLLHPGCEARLLSTLSLKGIANPQSIYELHTLKDH